MRAALDAEATRVGQGLLHSQLADVAERLGEHSLALEYWLDGASFTAWAGLSEILGRTLRRIALVVSSITTPRLAPCSSEPGSSAPEGRGSQGG